MSGVKLNRRIVVDTREQTPWFSTLPDQPTHEFDTVCETLPTGDYTLEGLRHLILIERKSLPDLVCCVGRDRDRFARELSRLRDTTLHPWLFIEGNVEEVARREYPGHVRPAAVVGSLLGWSLYNTGSKFFEYHVDCSKDFILTGE